MRERIINNIQSAFGDFNEILGNTVRDLTVSPEQFNPHIWQIVVSIYNIILPVSISMLGLFFIMDFLSKSTRLEFMRWQNVIKPLLKVAVAQFIVLNSLMLLKHIFALVSGIISQVSTVGTIEIPNHETQYLVDAVEGMGLIEQIAFNANIYPWLFVMNLIKIAVYLVVYGRMLEVYIKIAISPLPLATIANDGLHNIAKTFLQGYFAVCLQGLIIVVGVMLYGAVIKGLDTGGLSEGETMGMIRNTVISSSILLYILIKSGAWAKQVVGLGG